MDSCLQNMLQNMHVYLREVFFPQATEA